MLNCLFWRVTASAGQLLGPDLAESETPPRAPSCSARKYSAGGREGGRWCRDHTPPFRIFGTILMLQVSCFVTCQNRGPAGRIRALDRRARVKSGNFGKKTELHGLNGGTRSVPQLPATCLNATTAKGTRHLASF